MNEELRLEIEHQMEKLNQNRDNATSIEELKNIAASLETDNG